MKKIVATTLLTLSTVPASIFFIQPAEADTTTHCYPVIQRDVIQNYADHPSAYADGYSEGRQSARNREAYQPRTAGGEFARGFDDGYYGYPFAGQAYAVPNRVREYTTQHCDTYTSDRDSDHYHSHQERWERRRRHRDRVRFRW